jgi:hypothetical protein
MASEPSSSATPLIRSINPSEELVTSLLKRTNDLSKEQKLVEDHWRRIQSENPALARLISVNSFRQAPNDPELREVISSSMVLMDIIQQEITIQGHLIDSIGDSMSQYFPL